MSIASTAGRDLPAADPARLDARAGVELPARLEARLLLALLVVGVAVRLTRYLLCFPLWDDETALVVHLLDRGYLDLMRPLDFEQVSPVGFLWLQLTAVRCFGFSEYAVRLPALLAGLLSLPLMLAFARRWLRGTALVAAVGLFAVAYPLTRYAAEAKPYGVDVCLTLVLLNLTAAWWQDGRRRWLAGLLVATPLALFTSYPMVFVAGGISLLMAYAAWRRRRPGDLPSWILYSVVAGVAAAAIFTWIAADQSAPYNDALRFYWRSAMPPLKRPWSIPLWLLTAHSGELLAYPFGADRGGSAASLLLAIVGAAWLVRQRQAPLLLLIFGPLALNLAAATLKRYPYGAAVRFQVYLAPLLCLVIGVGLGALVIGLRRSWQRAAADRSNARGRANGAPPNWRISLAAAALAAVALSTIGLDMFGPRKGLIDAEYRAACRRTWSELAQHYRVVCMHRDLALPFLEETYATRRAAMYRCDQAIFERPATLADEVAVAQLLNPPGHRPATAADGHVLPAAYQSGAARVERLSAESATLACVALRLPDLDYRPALEAWLRQQRGCFEIVGHESIALHGRPGRRDPIREEGYLEVYLLAPCAAVQLAMQAR